MVECEFCGEEFDSDEELHLHWGEEHEDELNSHQSDKVNKAERKIESKKDSKKAWRRKIAVRGVVGLVALGLALVLAQQIMSQSSGSQMTGFQLDSQPALTQEVLNDNATASDPVASNDTVKIVEFGDYSCSYCQSFNQEIKPKLISNYIETGQAQFHYINFDILGPDSTKAALADECVLREDADNYWDFHNALFASQGGSSGWVTDTLLSDLVNEHTDASGEEVLSCINSQETLDAVENDKKIGLDNELSGTPVLFVNGEKVSNPTSWSVVKASIEKELG